MLVIVAAAFLVVVVVVMVMVVMVLVLLFKSLYSICKGVLLLHCGKNVLAVKAIPRSNYHGSGGVMLTEHFNRGGNLIILC